MMPTTRTTSSRDGAVRLVSIPAPHKSSSGTAVVGVGSKHHLNFVQIVSTTAILGVLLGMSVFGVVLAQNCKRKSTEIALEFKPRHSITPAPEPESSPIVHKDPASRSLPVPPRRLEPPARVKPEIADSLPPVVASASPPVQLQEPSTPEPPVKIAPAEDLPAPRAKVDDPVAAPRIDPREPKEKLEATKEPVKDPNIERFGTKIDFHTIPANAFKKAEEEKKLVMVLHITGNFEKNAFVNDDAEALRSEALLDDDVHSLVSRHLIATYQMIPAPKPTKKERHPGSVTTYFCTPAQGVIHAIPGPVDAKIFLKEANWMLDVLKDAKRVPNTFTTSIKRAHQERFWKDYQDAAIGMAPPLFFPKGPPLGFFGGPGGLPGMPGMPLPPQPRQQLGFPLKRPTEMPPQNQVHWVLSRHTLETIEQLKGQIDLIARDSR